jgi:hypothetical protein
VTKSLQADARQTQLFVGFSIIGFFSVSGFLPLACTVCGGFGGVFCGAFPATTSPASLAAGLAPFGGAVVTLTILAPSTTARSKLACIVIAPRLFVVPPLGGIEVIFDSTMSSGFSRWKMRALS